MRSIVVMAGVVLCAPVLLAGSRVAMDNQGRRARPDAAGPVGAESPGHAVRGSGWSALGPFGGDAQVVSFSPADPSVALCGIAPAGSSGGSLFRSTDGGLTWSEVPALSGLSVYDAEFTPTGDAYIATISGVWKSTDGGSGWTPLNLGIGVNQQVFDVEIDPNNASVIWAGVADALGGQSANVLKSTNGGLTWSDVSGSIGAMSANSIAVNPLNSDNVVVAFGGGFGGGGVWVTDNGGVTWANRSSGLPGNPMNAVVHDGATIYVGGGQAFGGQFAGLYASTNNGVTWTPLHDASWPQRIVRGVSLDPTDSGTIYVSSEPGIHKSTDGGQTWSVSIGGTGSVTANGVSFVPGDASAVFAAVNGRAVLSSTDGGAVFDQSADGIGALNVVSVAGDPNNADRLAIAFEGLNDGGVFSSEDGGQSWSVEPVPATRWKTVGYSPDGTLYAISDGPSTIAPEGLYRREGDGSWTGLGPDQGTFFESRLFEMLFGQAGSGLIILVGQDFGVAGSEATIWRSTDGGAGWTKVVERDPNDARVVNDVVFVPGTNESVLVASVDDWSTPMNGLAMRSTDGGATWSDAATGLLGGVRPQQLCANGSGVFLAASEATAGAGGLYGSTDGGQTWVKTAFASRLFGVVCDPTDDAVLYGRQFSAPKVLRSADSGDTFAAFDAGLEAAGTSRDLELVGGSRLMFGSGSGAYSLDLVSGCNAADLAEPFGALDLADIQAFLVAFLGGDPAADLAEPFGVLDLADLSAFVQLFLGGCP